MHFQDPKSAQYAKEAQRALMKTKNKRNDTSYNFIKSTDTNKEKILHSKRIISQKTSPMRDILKPDENLNNSNISAINQSTLLQRYYSKQQNSSMISDTVFRENKGTAAAINGQRSSRRS